MLEKPDARFDPAAQEILLDTRKLCRRNGATNSEHPPVIGSDEQESELPLLREAELVGLKRRPCLLAVNCCGAHLVQGIEVPSAIPRPDC